jgi:hypothetical protein
LLYSTILHLLAGSVTGSVFRVRTLLILLGLVLVESLILAFVQSSIAGPWAVANIVGVQVGYFAGIFARGVLEHAGYSLPSVRPRRFP